MGSSVINSGFSSFSRNLLSVWFRFSWLGLLFFLLIESPEVPLEAFVLHTCYCFLDRVYVNNRVEKASGELGYGSLCYYYLVRRVKLEFKMYLYT